MKPHKRLLLCLCLLTGAAIASNSVADDYDVNTSNGTWTGGGVAPPPTCTTTCSNEYHTCTADCFRGAVETFAGCMASCRISYCTEECK